MGFFVCGMMGRFEYASKSKSFVCHWSSISDRENPACYMKKSWIEKRDCEKSFKIKTIDKKFADISTGSKMLIASPPIIDEYIKSILYGQFVEPVKMRDDLAKDYQADKTCPVTTGIFLRIVSEASYEEYDNGIDLNAITPFWRMVNPKSKLAEKLACGIDFIAERQTIENIIL